MSTNHMYAKGTIVFINDRALKWSQFEYLSNRPLLVVSDPNPLFPAVTVVPITTKKRPGIKIVLNGKLDNKDRTSVYRESVIEPWSPITISTNSIYNTNGSVDSLVMKAVTKALAFHMGLTDEVPPYLKPLEYSFVPNYQIANSDNINKEMLEELTGQTHPNLRLGDTYTKELNYQFNNDTGNAIVDAFNNARTAATEKYIDSYHPDGNEENNSSYEELLTNICTSKSEEINDNISEEGTTKRVRKEYSVRYHSVEEIIKGYNLSNKDLVKIYRRDLMLKDIEERYNIPRHHALRLRKEFVENLPTMTKKINKKLKKNAANFIKLTEIERVAAACYIDMKHINVPNRKVWAEKVNEYRKKNNVDKTNMMVWRRQFKEKEMYI